ncbi:ABC transporter permease [Microbacterium pygmaeum]|uniref:ABC-2 type transport system permease protein n=1 Tax=Microbacterium pygmaeum TaxID=370764 RepID=A0A1G7VUH5_9MICO|nr:polyketide antibiotic transporter [Microbacterium pygmaeum]SDG63327.1 ABC-2 type transport system permease protein [Microbacterium pygmaeum]
MSTLGPLLAQRIRRDWRQVLMWSIGIALLAYLASLGVAQSYGTQQDRESLLAAAIANPVILLFRGLPSGAEEGAFMLFLIFPWLAILAAFMSTFLAVRHTRMDEELGRTELVAATPAGRTMPLLATLVHGVLANILVGVLTALALLATGAGTAGSVISGAAVGAVGIVFLGVGLLAGQLMRTSRGANALAVWIVVATFVLSGIGNAVGTPGEDLQRMQSSWVTWLSPFGWGENVRPFADDDPTPILLCIGAGGVLIALAWALQSVRDIDQGLVPERRGRAEARASLGTAGALVWRLTRGAVVGWTIGGLITGVLSTSLASVVDSVSADNPAIDQVLTALGGSADLAQATVTVFFTMLGVLAACCAVQVICRARQEEAADRAEPVLVSPVGRVRWLGDYVLDGFGGIVLVIAAGAVGAAIGIAAQRGDWSLLQVVAVTGGGQVAAASVFLVLTSLVFVLAPRATLVVGWSLVVIGMILGLFGPLFGFPDWLIHLAPVGVAPEVTADGVDLRGLWWLLLATVVGSAASLLLMRRRELATDG